MSASQDTAAAARIDQQHRELLAAQHDLLAVEAEYLSSPDVATRGRLSAALQAYSIELGRHFDEEETDGFLSRQIDDSPNTAAEVARLVAEHDEMRREVETLAQRTESDTASPCQLHRLLEQVMRHEESERNLMMESYWRDGAAED